MRGLYIVEVEFESESFMTDKNEYVPGYTAYYTGKKNFLDDEIILELDEITEEDGTPISVRGFSVGEIKAITNEAYDKLAMGRFEFQIY